MTISDISGHTGIRRTSNGKDFNVADLGRHIERTLRPINAFEVAEAFPLIALKSNYGLSELRDVTDATGSGAVSNAVGDDAYSLSTGATASSTATLDSIERGRYIAGTVAIPGMGVRVPTLPTGEQVGRWGYFDDDDGFGFGVDATGLFVFRRYQGTDDVVYQGSWSEDTLDGTGDSGASIDLADVNIYQIPFRWYGGGPASFDISTDDTMSDLLRAHVYRSSNEPIIGNPNLPLRAEVENGATASDFTLEVYGRQFSVLGRYEPNRRITPDYRINVGSVSTTFLPMVTFKQKTDYASVSVKIAGMDILAANADLLVEVRVDASLTGASYAAPSNIPATETALEFDKSATAVTGGQVIYTTIVAAGTGTKSLGRSADIPALDVPVNQPITVCVRTITGTATVSTVLRAREDW